MNRKTKIILISLLAFITVILIVIGTFALMRYIDKYDVNNNDNSNIPNEKIYLFNKELDSLDEIEEQDIQEYVKIMTIVFKGETYSTFSDDDITSIVAYKLLMNGEKASNDEVQEFVKGYFGKKDFQLKEGEYLPPIGEKVIISKEGDKFMSNLWGKGAPLPYNRYKSMEILNNQVIVHYDYGNFSPSLPEQNIVGITDVYLEYIEGNLIFKKIVYTEN